MLLVNDHEVEAEVAENFDGVGGRSLDEGADQPFTAGKALAEGGRGGAGWGRHGFASCCGPQVADGGSALHYPLHLFR
jgi:hypothetical protein